ncbi:MAG TPA: proteasome subunit beta, partial [Acidimicrobiia bacterium]|nr:proteasome subunit beta [Acidimicrobiia bacterium]
MPDSESLPRFSASTDPGPSFADLLRHVAPHQLPGAGMEHPMTGEIPHSTTVVAIRYASGVIMAGDRRATAGYT